MHSDTRIASLISEFPELNEECTNWNKELYAHFGLLFSGYALLEASLQNCFVFRELQLELLAGEILDQSGWELAHARLEATAFSLTLGNLIKRIKHYPEFGPHVDRLSTLKRQRDYFAHHFFREELASMSIDEKIPSLVAALNRQRIEVKAVELLCQEISESLLRVVFPSVELEEKVAQMVDKLKNSFEVQDLTKNSQFGWEVL